MKRYLLVVLLALTPLFFGLQTAFSQADTDSRGNAAPGEALPEELGDLDIKDYYIGSEAEPVGLIQTVTGHVVVLHVDTNEAYFAAKGDAIFQQDALFTLVDSRCRAKFSTEDVITMAEDSQISVDEFIDDRETEKKKSTFSMLKGKAMFYVVPLFRYKDTSTSVETPTAVCGVRGTKFGVGVGEDTQTLVYGFEGDVEVYSPVDGTTQMVGEGENLQLTRVGAGDVQDMSLGMAERFMLDTEAPAPEGQEAGTGDQGIGEQAEAGGEEQGPAEEEGSSEEEAAEGEESAEGEEATEGKGSNEEEGFEGEESGEGEWAPDKDEGGDNPDFQLSWDDPLGFLNPNDDPIDPKDLPDYGPEAPTDDPWPIKHFGYFTGMLTMANGTKIFKHLYLSDSLQDCDSGSGTARDQLPDPNLIMQVDGSEDYDDPKITMLDIETDTITSSAFPFIIQHGDLGHNAYMEWGYWTQTQAMPGQSVDVYFFDNRGYYVFGDYTTNARMSDLASHNVSGTYSGGAHGTYWTYTGGENMSGNFSADVNFASGSISNFKVGVSGGGHSVLIDGASGGFTTGSQFELNPATGTWQIDGSDADTGAKEAYGSVYGPNGEAIGGVWKLDNDANGAHATGMFQGTR